MESENKVSLIINRLFLAVALILIAAMSILIVSVPRSNGYEYSIYHIFPVIFWIFAGILFLLPFIYLYISQHNNKIIFQKKTAQILLIVALLTYILIMYIPFSRGYFMYAGGDTHTHLGYVNEILEDGRIHHTYYPYSHVFVGITSILTGITSPQITFHIVPLFITIFIIGIFCLTNALKCTDIQKIAITAFATLPTFGIWFTQESIMPSTISWTLFPIFFFTVLNLFITVKHHIWIVPTSILFIAISVAHPEGIVYSIFILLIALLCKGIFTLIQQREIKKGWYAILIFPGVMFAVAIVFFSVFPNLANMISHSLSDILNIISGFATYFTGNGTRPSFIELAKSLLGTNSPFREIYAYGNLKDSFGILVGRYGQILLISLLALIYIIYSISKMKRDGFDTKQSVIFILFILLSILAIALLASGCSIAHHIYRQWKYPLLFAIFICGLFFTEIVLSEKKTKAVKILSIIFTIFMISMVSLSLNNIYDNQDISGVYWQVSNQDVTGMSDFYETSVSSIYIVETGVRQHQERYYHLLYGIDDKQINIRSTFNRDIVVPPSLGYDDNDKIGDSYTNPVYFLKYPPIMYMTNIFKTNGYYPGNINPIDYEHLNYDTSAKLIQNTGNDLSVYLITPAI